MKGSSSTIYSQTNVMKLVTSSIRLVAWVLSATALASAGGPSVANVSSIQNIVLDGHAVAAAGVTSWPLVVGDTLQSTTSDATVVFPDGSHITLSPQSKLRIEGTLTKPRIVLVSGNLDYKLSPGSDVTLSSASEPDQADQSPQQDNPDPNPQTNTAPTKPRHHHPQGVVHSQAFYFFEGALVAGIAVGGADAIYHVITSNNGQPTLSPGSVSH